MRNFVKSFLILSSIFFVYLFAQLAVAQDLGGGYDLSGGEGDEANFFLQKAITEDDALKTKAEQFNGARSGVYEGSRLSCPYAFERDLFVGSKGEDVRLMQVLLNSDKRTLIAVSGPGSLGQESDSYGEATKEAVKKFQALFIEYTGVANGRFGPRTRTVMNAICNGENQPSNAPTLEARQNRNIYENIFSVQKNAVPGGIATTNVGVDADGVPPRVSLSANVSSVKMGETFKVILSASEEIVPISPDSLIVDGGTVKEIRKLSKTSYTATIIINEEEGVKNVLVQVEADKIEDLIGNKNESASNEISVKVIPAEKIAEATASGEGEVGLNSLLDKIIASAPQCNYNGSGILVTVAPDGKPVNTTGCAPTQTQNQPGAGQTYDCNGQKIPVTQPCQQQTQTVCTIQPNPYTGIPQQVCQQVSQQQAQAMQQAQQNQQMGQLLGQLMRGFGGGQNGTGPGGNPGANNNFNPGPGYVPPPTDPGAGRTPVQRAEEQVKDLETKIKNQEKAIDELCKKDDDKSKKECKEARAGLQKLEEEKLKVVEAKKKAEDEAWEKQKEEIPFFATKGETTKVQSMVKNVCYMSEAGCKDNKSWTAVNNTLYGTTYDEKIKDATKHKFFLSKSDPGKLDGMSGFLPENTFTKYSGFTVCSSTDLAACAKVGNSIRKSGTIYVQNPDVDNSYIEKAFILPKKTDTTPAAPAN